MDFLNLLTLPAVETNTVYYRQEKHNNGGTKIFTATNAGKDQIFNYLGLTEIKMNRIEKAIAWMDSAIRHAPDNPSYWINRGTMRFDHKDYKGAAADLQQAIKIEPDNSLALHNLATVKAALGETAASETLLTEAIEKNRDLPFPLAERAYQKLQKNDLKGALEDYDEVVKLEPSDEENYINRGLVKERMKDFSGAMKDFSKAIEINEKNERAWLSHGNIMSKTKKWDTAIEDYSMAVTLDPEYGLAFFNRAMAYQNVKNPIAACKDLRKSEDLGLRIESSLKSKICH
ncbi:MAG TPA: tetratricopeptide repeat protein [Cyclobacteriaceae bacterium]|nr:tetratricopeptide repeat protein [Cyclobacteriaceae bacterium]